MSNLLSAINNAYKNNENFVIATALEKSGLSPRNEGAKMLIKQDFSIEGTIGGGLIEAMTIQAAAKVFTQKAFIIERFVLPNEDKGSPEMVCDGSLNILLEYVDYNDKIMMEFFKEITRLKNNKIDFVIITRIPKEENRITDLEKWICTETGLYGSESDEILGIIKEIKENFDGIKYREPFLERNQYFMEPFFNNENVCIVGAGHVGKVLAEFCKILGFYVVVIDDRCEFANSKRFKTADEIIVVPSFDCMMDYVKINQYSYVIIVTRGHIYDREVLAQMLLTEARYIGVIGGKSKWKHMKACLLEEGFMSEELKRVHSPIGLPINGKTTEEIAISIVAEMIQVRREPLIQKNKERSLDEY